MQAVDFVLYCLGTSSVLVASAAAYRIAAGARNATAANKTKETAAIPKWEPVPDPSTEDLAGRLQVFQAARFASPIVQRQLDPQAGPPTRLQMPSRPNIRPTTARPPVAPPRKPQTEGEVVIPLRNKKNTNEE